MAEVRWVVEIICGFQWRVFVGWLCICVCVCLRVGTYMCEWVVPGVCVASVVVYLVLRVRGAWCLWGVAEALGVRCCMWILLMGSASHFRRGGALMDSKSQFSNFVSFVSSYVSCLLLITACRFTCGESKIW